MCVYTYVCIHVYVYSEILVEHVSEKQDFYLDSAIN